MSSGPGKGISKIVTIFSSSDGITSSEHTKKTVTYTPSRNIVRSAIDFSRAMIAASALSGRSWRCTSFNTKKTFFGSLSSNADRNPFKLS